MSSIDSGHTAWVLASMALVQLMLPGLAFFYAGLLHRNSVVAMIMQNFAAMVCVRTVVLWFDPAAQCPDSAVSRFRRV